MRIPGSNGVRLQGVATVKEVQFLTKTFASMLENTRTFARADRGVISLQEDESDFKAHVLPRQTPKWLTSTPVAITCKCSMHSLATGRLPVGLLPAGTVVPSRVARERILGQLRQIPDNKYHETDANQRVRSWGKPFVDSPTVNKHLSSKVDPRVEALTVPLVKRITRYLRLQGFQVAPLVDPLTAITYPAGVFRAINVVNDASVLHTDDFVRDGLKKPDFRMPALLVDREFFQISFNVLLDDGGYEPDSLFVFNRFHVPADEKRVQPNGWQFPLTMVQKRQVCRYTPSTGAEYVFCTTNYHDVRGGSPLANRVTFSIFALYVPSLNLMMLYN